MRAKWSKVWADELFGTINGISIIKDFTAEERWAFVALRALCANSKYQPLICVNPSIGWSDIQIATMLGSRLSIWKKVKAKLLEKGRIQVDDMNVILLKGWDKYRSEYWRQKKYRDEGYDDGPSSREVESAARAERNELIQKVIEHLNQRTGKAFRESNIAARKHIQGRIVEGAKLEDFIYVINIKAKQWLHTEMDGYLRPQTLFNSEKFWGYRNEREGVGIDYHLRKPGSPTKDRFVDKVTEEAFIQACHIEYDLFKKDHMEKHGIHRDEDIDWFRFPTFTDYLNNKLKIREGKNEPERQRMGGEMGGEGYQGDGEPPSPGPPRR